MELKEIGTVISNIKRFTQVRHLPRNGWTDDTCIIKLKPQYRLGLGGLDGFSRVIILFWVSQHKQWKMPKDNPKPKCIKIFATRIPVRPNPIGLSVVELLDFSPQEGTIKVKGLDAIDGTPILDIKPYLPHFDSYPEATVPEWIARHLRNEDGHSDGHPACHPEGGHNTGHDHSEHDHAHQEKTPRYQCELRGERTRGVKERGSERTGE
jgi:tRNA (adenine37-N6)-methyltransferase